MEPLDLSAYAGQYVAIKGREVVAVAELFVDLLRTVQAEGRFRGAVVQYVPATPRLTSDF